MKKYKFPLYHKLDLEIPLKLLQKDYLAMTNMPECNKEIFKGRGCQILDLTYIDPKVKNYSHYTRFAGSSTERAVANYLEETKTLSTEQRLQVTKQRNPLANDCNHNTTKKQFTGFKTMDWIYSLGNVSKITFATLGPNFWWPSHYDFSTEHSCKINIPIFTNKKAVSLSWSQKAKSLKKVYMKEGECWWINPGYKHTAFNWGEVDRTFLLITFADNTKIKEWFDVN